MDGFDNKNQGDFSNSPYGTPVNDEALAAAAARAGQAADQAANQIFRNPGDPVEQQPTETAGASAYGNAEAGTDANAGAYSSGAYNSANSGSYNSGSYNGTGSYQTYDSNGNYVGGGTAPAGNGPSGIQIASLILGILGILGSCCAWVGLIFAVPGMILALVGNSKNKNGVGTAGLVCSIIGIVFAVIMTVIGVLLVLNGFGDAQQSQELMNEIMNNL